MYTSDPKPQRDKEAQVKSFKVEDLSEEEQDFMMKYMQPELENFNKKKQELLDLATSEIEGLEEEKTKKRIELKAINDQTVTTQEELNNLEMQIFELRAEIMALEVHWLDRILVFPALIKFWKSRKSLPQLSSDLHRLESSRAELKEQFEARFKTQLSLEQEITNLERKIEEAKQALLEKLEILEHEFVIRVKEEFADNRELKETRKVNQLTREFGCLFFHAIPPLGVDPWGNLILTPKTTAANKHNPNLPTILTQLEQTTPTISTTVVHPFVEDRPNRFMLWGPFGVILTGGKVVYASERDAGSLPYKDNPKLRYVNGQPVGLGTRMSEYLLKSSRIRKVIQKILSGEASSGPAAWGELIVAEPEIGAFFVDLKSVLVRDAAARLTTQKNSVEDTTPSLTLLRSIISRLEEAKTNRSAAFMNLPMIIRFGNLWFIAKSLEDGLIVLKRFKDISTEFLQKQNPNAKTNTVDDLLNSEEIKKQLAKEFNHLATDFGAILANLVRG